VKDKSSLKKGSLMANEAVSALSFKKQDKESRHYFSGK
jgi:hypothetical protein